MQFERDKTISVCLTSICFPSLKVYLTICTKEQTIEQRVFLKFCVSNEITATESLKMGFGESTLPRTEVLE